MLGPAADFWGPILGLWGYNCAHTLYICIYLLYICFLSSLKNEWIEEFDEATIIIEYCLLFLFL